MGTNIGIVQQDSPRVISEGVEALLKLNRRGEAAIIDFYTQMVLEGRAYNLRMTDGTDGLITDPMTSDVAITDTAAEACVDAPAGVAVIPTQLCVDIESLGGTLPAVAAKSVGTVSTVGNARAPLPLFLQNANVKAAARATGRCDAAGGVTVTAETAATTRLHYLRTLTVAGDAQAYWQPLVPPIIGGGACFYVQVGAVTTGCEYFGFFDFLEFLLNVLE